MEKKFFTVNDFHAELGGIISKGMIYLMIEKGEIPAKRIGNKIVLPAGWVHQFINDISSYSKQEA